MTLTRADIAKAIRKQAGQPKQQSADLVDSVFNIIKHQLENGEDVLISGFGKFSVKERRERKGRHPVTGEPMMLPPRKVVTFKCSGRLKNKLNESAET
ncbi:MAG: integration host factor subunit alpha [Deltaproteobacteria bacterium]|nr:MAG: integration host factor subunit alpha [Deltaproteobacteria bacterium]